MNSPAGKAVRAKLRGLFWGFRWRLLLMVALIQALAFALASFYVLSTSRQQGERDLELSLEQAVDSYSFVATRSYESLTARAEELAADPIWRALLGSNPLDEAKKRELKERTVADLGSVAGDLLLIVDSQRHILFQASRPQNKQLDSQRPTLTEVDFAQGPLLLPTGTESNPQRLEFSFLEPLFKLNEVSRGFMLYPDPRHGDLIAVVGVAIDKERPQDGALVLGKRLDDSSLIKLAQGMPRGIVLITTGDRLSLVYDNRSGTRPTPTMAAALEEMLKGWDPARGEKALQTGSLGLSFHLDDAPLAGRQWKAAVVNLGNLRNSGALGYLIFLADPQSLTTQLDLLTRGLITCGLLSLVVQIILLFFCAPLATRFARPYWQLGVLGLVEHHAQKINSELGICNSE